MDFRYRFYSILLCSYVFFLYSVFHSEEFASLYIGYSDFVVGFDSSPFFSSTFSIGFSFLFCLFYVFVQLYWFWVPGTYFFEFYGLLFKFMLPFLCSYLLYVSYLAGFFVIDGFLYWSVFHIYSSPFFDLDLITDFLFFYIGFLVSVVTLHLVSILLVIFPSAVVTQCFEANDIGV